MSAQMHLNFRPVENESAISGDVFITCHPKTMPFVQQLFQTINEVETLRNEIKTKPDWDQMMDELYKHLGLDYSNINSKENAFDGIHQAIFDRKKDLKYLVDAVVDCRLAVIRADEIVKKYEIKL